MKNRLITVLVVLALFIPGIIAIVNYTYLKNTPIEYRSLSHVDITDLDGAVFKIEDGTQAGKNALQFFVTMNKNANPADSLPTEVGDRQAFTFTYYSYAMKTDYKYYFSQEADNAYYVNDKGKVYKIASADAASFLCTCYARSLYADSGVPTLTLSDVNAVVPASIKWTFRDIRGEYIDYDTDYETSKALANYEVASDFGMKFSVDPDYFSITVTQDGTELYKGDYASLALPTTLDMQKKATVEITAEWYESVEHIFAGSATYRFDATLVPPPVFSLASSDGDMVEKGGLIVLTGKNVKDPSQITVNCEPALGYTPVWFENQQNGSVYALVPIPIEANLDNVSTLNFTVNAGGTESRMSIAYENNTFQTLSGLNEAGFAAAFAAVTEQIPMPSDGAVYFDGVFRNPVETTSGLKGFGRMVDSSYRHLGVDFTNVHATDRVYAGAAGTVVYVGNLSTGEAAVVIEHGLGLRSWYVGMNTVNADLTVGASIAAGAQVGTCAEGKLHCSITVFGEQVSPYKFWSFTADNPGFLKLK